VPQKNHREAITALPKAGVKPKGRNDLYIAVAVAVTERHETISNPPPSKPSYC